VHDNLPYRHLQYARHAQTIELQKLVYLAAKLFSILIASCVMSSQNLLDLWCSFEARLYASIIRLSRINAYACYLHHNNVQIFDRHQFHHHHNHFSFTGSREQEVSAVSRAACLLFIPLSDNQASTSK
jgi:hypothetical protein